MAQAVFYGASGGKYVFEVYPLNAEFHNVGGIYISTYRYVNQRSEVKYKPLYIGKTGSFSDRLTNAHKALDCVFEHDFNYICAYTDNDASSRERSEIDLLNNYNTPCNVQHQ